MSEAKRPYPLRIPESLMVLAEAKSLTEWTDRSTALRQLLYAAAESWALDLLGEGRIGTSQATEVLGVSVYRVHELAEKHRLQAGADLGDYRCSREASRGILK
jgi:hypothetical protein